jgi:hypothetical protein
VSARSSPEWSALATYCLAGALAVFVITGCRSRPHRPPANPELAEAIQRRRDLHDSYRAEVFGRFLSKMVNGSGSLGDEILPSYPIYEWDRTSGF